MEEKKMKKIESFKKNNQGNKKERKPFLQWYDEDKRPLKAMLKLKVLTVLTLLVCMGVMFLTWEFVISVGFFNYSDDTYKEMETLLGKTVTENVGCDIYEIQKNVDSCKFEYNKGKDSTLIISQNLGYFKPVVTVKINENYRIIESFRNYNSLEEYLIVYRIRFALFVFGGGLLVWLLILCLPHAVLYVIKKIFQNIQKVKKIDSAKEAPEKIEKKAVA